MNKMHNKRQKPYHGGNIITHSQNGKSWSYKYGVLQNRTPFSTVALQHKSVSSVLRYARPLSMNRIQFRTWPVKHKAVSSVPRYARPRFHRLFCPSTPNEDDDAFHSDPAGWLPMNTTMMPFLRSDPPNPSAAS